MIIDFEKFSVVRAPRQARDLHRFVQDEHEWLAEFYEGTARRNRNLPHAIYNVARLAILTQRDGERHSYLIHFRQNGRRIRMLGTATIILDSEVMNPSTGEVVHAHDLDYAVRAGSNALTHRIIARDLASEALGLHNFMQDHSGSNSEQHPFRLMAAIDPHNPHPAIGLTELPDMQPVGVPMVLRTASGQDYHQIDKGGAVLQLYATTPSYA